MTYVTQYTISYFILGGGNEMWSDTFWVVPPACAEGQDHLLQIFLDVCQPTWFWRAFQYGHRVKDHTWLMICVHCLEQLTVIDDHDAFHFVS